MVFQHYALFPHLDVGANVAFGLESRGVRGAELSRRVAEALALVDLAGFERRAVAQLSGGQQQRVALARALAPEPQVLLLDEPLSNLDPALRERTRRELRALVHRLGMTTVVVTHEQEEAFDLGDRIALLRGGRLEQVGTADELYAAPATAFVAWFIGRASELAGPDRSPADVAEVEGVRWPARWAGPGAAAPGAAAPAPRPARGPAAGAARRGSGRRHGHRIADSPGPSPSSRCSPPAAPRSKSPRPPDAAREGDAVGLAPTGADLHLFPPDAIVTRPSRRMAGVAAGGGAGVAHRLPAGAGPHRGAPRTRRDGRSRRCVASRAAAPSGRRCGTASGSRWRASSWPGPSACRWPSSSSASISRGGSCSACWWRLPAVLPPLVGVVAFLFLYGETGFAGRLVQSRLRPGGSAVAARRAGARSCWSTPTRCTSTSTCSAARRSRGWMGRCSRPPPRSGRGGGGRCAASSSRCSGRRWPARRCSPS